MSAAGAIGTGRAAGARRPLARWLVVTVLLAACTGSDDSPPAEPSVRTLNAWLDAFNSGDRDRYTDFLVEHYPRLFLRSNMNQEMAFREMSGGFDLRELERVSTTEVVGLLEARASDTFARVELTVVPTAPYDIAGLDLLVVPRPAEYAISPVAVGEAIAQLEAAMHEHEAADRFSGAVLVARGGEVLFERAYGMADRERGIPNTVETRFRIASMSKMFTAVAVLQLVGAGEVDLETPIGTYLPDYPNEEVATQVTIHHLLTHTGGTGDIFGPAFDAHREELRTLDDYVGLYGRRAPGFEPGRRFEYSNYGFLLLGVVIEAVTGQSYYDYVKDGIFGPAGMTSTGSPPGTRSMPDRSVGYMHDPESGDWVPNTDTLPFRGTSAGGAYSTVGDLARFADALLGHELLGPRLTELLLTEKVDSGPGAGYAYGFDDQRHADGNGWVGHGGGAPGMNGDLRIYPRSGYVVVALANMDPPAASRITEFLDLRLPTG